MNTEGGTKTQNTQFNFYSGGVYDADCVSGYQSNHQITLVGYGKYKGEDVWVW